MQSVVILIHRSHLRLKTFSLQQTEMACIMVFKTRLIVNHHSFGRKKTRQVKSSVSCLPLCPIRTIYTYLQNKRMRRCGVPPPPPIIFERLKLPKQIIYRRKENLSESPNHQKYWENILASRFYEQFSRNRRNLGHFQNFEKISNSQNMNILYIILKHVIWRFQIYNLFREIFKFREDKSNNVFREIRKCFRKTAKSEFFAKQIIYLESPDHPLQNDI